MTGKPLSVEDFGTSSVLQLTLWPSKATLRETAAMAFAALGHDPQQSDLERLGRDFVSYLAFDDRQPGADLVVDFETRAYPMLEGFVIAAATQSTCQAGARTPTKRSARVLTSERNGALIRGFGGTDREVMLVFWRLTSIQWRRLAEKLGWNPDDLSTANAPGIVFQLRADPDMSLLSPTAWM